MKVSLLMSTYNKNDVLPNTLYSISRQKTTFPLEVCIVDDCSTVDPEPIIKGFLPDAKYRRLSEHIGPFDRNQCLDLMSPDTDVVILQSCDVIHAQPFAVEELCKHVGDKTITLAEVIDIPVDVLLFQNFDFEVQQILGNWESYIYSLTMHVGRGRSNQWLFFLGAIRKTDLESIGYEDNSCDAVLHQTMRRHNFHPPNLLAYVRGIHQCHIKTWYTCPLVEKCEFYCSRTEKLKGIKPRELYTLDANVLEERNHEG